MSNQSREQFEAAVIARMKESGFLAVEVRVEMLGRDGDDYTDPSVSTYWHYWQEARATLVVERPTQSQHANTVGDYAKGYRQASRDYQDAIEAAGAQVKS